jgi:hypothetical protein
MAVEVTEPQPLEYAARPPPPPPRRRVTRDEIVALLGAATALIGTVLFACAHKLTDYDTLVAEHARLHELLWAAFGIALLLAGAMIAAAGLSAWCRSGAL